MQFPRDWLGPREELIPFGSAADRAAGAALGDERAPGGDTESWPQAADDFWGENSHSLHHALQGPAAAPDRALDEPPREAATGWRPLHAWRPMLRAVPPRLPKIAALAGALVLVVATAAVLSSTSREPAHAASASSRLLAGVVGDAALRIKVAQAVHGAAGAVRIRRTASLRHARVASRHIGARPHHARGGHQAAPASDHAAPVTSSSSTAAPPSSSSSSAPAGSGTTTRNEPPPKAVNASASHSSPVSPTGASGALGPVQSPNG